MQRQDQSRVFEVHHEVSFWALAGRPMQSAKDTAEGYEERRALLRSAFGIPHSTRPEARAIARPVDADDVLDASVAAWTALRAAERRAGCLPAAPSSDARGLRMEIVY
jgi:predicted RNase H-like nuclease